MTIVENLFLIAGFLVVGAGIVATFRAKNYERQMRQL